MSKEEKPKKADDLVGIRMKVKPEFVELVRIFAQKLNNGTIEVGQQIKVE